jgi:hypothetical protein
LPKKLKKKKKSSFRLAFAGDLCAPNPCANGGTCLSDGQSIRCSCRDGFQGDLCQICDACSPNPCLNDGLCQSNGLGGFACKCPPGTTGRTCDYGKNQHKSVTDIHWKAKNNPFRFSLFSLFLEK